MSRTIRYFAIAAVVIAAASSYAYASSPFHAASGAPRAWTSADYYYTIAPSSDHDGATLAADEKKLAKAQAAYIKALESDNDGVRASAAAFLGRYQLKGSIDALIQVLKTDKSEQARSAAAFSLILLNEEEGVKAVEEASLYDGSDRVAAFCARLLNLQTVTSFTESR